MAIFKIKTTTDFKSKGFYDIDKGIFTDEKTGDDISISEVLAALAKDGEMISIAIKHEDATEKTLEDIADEE